MDIQKFNEEMRSSSISIQTVLERQEDGTWKATGKYTSGYSRDGINWGSNTVEAQAFDSVPNDAYNILMVGFSNQINTEEFVDELYRLALESETEDNHQDTSE